MSSFSAGELRLRPPLVTVMVRHTACRRGNTLSHGTFEVSVEGLMGGVGRYIVRSASASAVKVGLVQIWQGDGLWR